MYRFALALLLSLPTLCLAAAPLPFSGEDLSGTYSCTGHDAADGDYQATVTLTMSLAQSTGTHGDYTLKMEVPGDGIYLGSVVANGDNFAITFTPTAPGSKDYGTGLGTVSSNTRGQIVLSKFYYEPEYRGGDHGTEDCVRQLQTTARATLQ